MEATLGIKIPELEKPGLFQRMGLRAPLVPRISDYLSIDRVLTFDEHWVPSFLDIPLRPWHFLCSPLKSGLTASMTYALRPVFEKLQLDWSAPRLKLGPVIVLLVFGATVAVGIIESLPK